MTLVQGAPQGTEPEVPITPKASAAIRRRSSEQLRVVSPKINLRQRLTEIWRYRELLGAMTRKEFKVQYKDSFLGFLWSLLNPATTLLVYYLVFQVILKNGIPRFAIYLMAGTLVWNFFSIALTAATGSVVANASIVKKVSFPREIPALASAGAALIQMGLQACVMVVFLIAFRRGPAMEYLPLIIPALIALIVLGASFGVLFAAVNVRFRDMQHLLGVGLNVWFWGTPVVYQYDLVRNKIMKWVTVHGHIVIQTSHWLPLFYLWRLNPVTPIVLTFQRALYGTPNPIVGSSPVTQVVNGVTKPVMHLVHGHLVPLISYARLAILPDHAGPWWYLWQDLLVLAFGLGLLVVALNVFGRLEGNFAEEM